MKTPQDDLLREALDVIRDLLRDGTAPRDICERAEDILERGERLT